MTRFMTSVAAAALICASPAFAAGAGLQLAQADQTKQMQPMQSTDGTASCPDGATETANGEACPPTAAVAPTEEKGSADATSAMPEEKGSADATSAMPEEKSTTTGALPDAETGDATATAPSDTMNKMAAASGQKFLQEQENNAILASELIGLNVYNTSDESLGDVNDIVWSDDGNIEGLVVGVGGFLGIGEKQVAVAYDAFDITTDENGNKKLMLNATSDELAAAPAFLTQADKLAQAQQAAQPPLPSAGGAGAPAPAAPEPAPAQ